ncbi:MAG: hypothetical protein JXA30_15505 [Deltaproteobacteria bacterium]|nr:hypothetical protein [Deltaproteobacteria bacterium]
MKTDSTAIRLAAVLVFLVSCDGSCDDDNDLEDGAAGFNPPNKDAESGNPDSSGSSKSGALIALSYNVAGLPEVISGSNPSVNMPFISRLLNDYDLVLVQEDWLAPDPNPFEGVFDVYHDVLAADALHPYRSEPASQPMQTDASRPEAILSDGLNRFSNLSFGELTRVAWTGCFGAYDTSDGGASDCLALKGFSVATHVFSDSVQVDIYNLHGEAGGTDRDQELSEADYEQLASFINSESSGRAIILGGDTNLHTGDGDRDAHDEEDARIWDDFKEATGLVDVCDVVSPCEPSIDKFAFRSNDSIKIKAISHRFERDKFVNDQGEPLSDHEPLAVGFRWSLEQ